VLVRTGNPFEEGWPRCPLCGKRLTRLNCNWRVFPGVCLDCAPPGITSVPQRPHHTPRNGSPVPRGLTLMRQCRCGRLMGRRRRMCERCRQEARRRRDRERQRRYRKKLREGK